MDSSLIANLDNVIAQNEFLSAQREMADLYYEPDSPLNRAQKMSDTLRQTQQRRPMVLEYYKDKDTVESIEMYINPDNMQFSASKVNNKTYTRGGIFYHHWGDDLSTLSISGNVGLSMMKGIEQLEKIYYYSGTLLRFQNAGVDVVNNGNQEDRETVDYNSPYGPIDYVTSTNLSNDTIGTIRKTASTSAQNKFANYLYSSSDLKNVEVADYVMENFSYAKELNNANVYINKIFLKLVEYQDKQISTNGYCNFSSLYQYSISMCSTIFHTYSKTIQQNLAFDLANGLAKSGENVLKQTTTNSCTELSNGKSSSIVEQLQAVQNYNKNSKITMDEIMPGIADIQDELTDEWRPRLIFMYFEDRVYIGHFDNFSWARNAQTPLITYNMKFTITRQLLMTSTSENREKPTPSYSVPKQELQSSGTSQNSTLDEKLKIIAEEAKVGKNTTAIDYILQIKGEWRLESDNARTNKTTFSDSKAAEYKSIIHKIYAAATYNGTCLIDKSNELFDDKMYLAQPYLRYYTYCLKKNHSFIKTIINAECRRIRKVMENEIKTWKPDRRDQVGRWAVLVYRAIDGAKYNHYDLNYVIKAMKLSV